MKCALLTLVILIAVGFVTTPVLMAGDGCPDGGDCGDDHGGDNGGDHGGDHGGDCGDGGCGGCGGGGCGS